MLPIGLLQPLIYADLVGLPVEAAKEAVLTAVSDDRPKPLQSPAFPGAAPQPARPEPAYPGPVLDIGRLPIPGPNFVGREAELARLDNAWEDPATHVLTLVAFGGVGKSALVARWMDRMAADGWRGAARVLDWSFYSQGMEDRVTSAEPFIDHALGFFGDPDPTAGSLHDRGARLAGLIRSERTLLVLDGIEPLQSPPGRPEIEGRLKDHGLAALLKGLAAGNPGLCVVTTRERIADLAGSPSTAPQIPLEELELDAAVNLLRQLRVDGRESELRAAAEEFQRHALTLTLLGNFLRKAFRAHLGLTLSEDRTVGLAQAAEHLGQAVEGLRRAAHEDQIPHGLLARAALRRFRSDFGGAIADLTEVLEIAERGSMRLHECDAHLEWARLCRDQGISPRRGGMWRERGSW